MMHCLQNSVGELSWSQICYGHKLSRLDIFHIVLSWKLSMEVGLHGAGQVFLLDVTPGSSLVDNEWKKCKIMAG